MGIYNERQLPSMPEIPISAPERIDTLRAYLGLTLGIAIVAVVSGLYDQSWKDRWRAAKNTETEVLEERDKTSDEDKWWELDQAAQKASRDKWSIEDEHPDESPV
jgi:hypothetical protein